MEVRTTLQCTNSACKSTHIVRNGKQPNGKQRYICKDCSNSFSDAPRKVHDESFKKSVALLYKSGKMSYREIAKTFDISPQTVKNWVTLYKDL